MVAVLGGSMAALHVGKVPPALPAIRAELAIDLVTAGWLMALVSGIGAVLGLLSGRMADRIGHRDAMIIGLALLAVGSIGGALAGGIGMLLVTRGIEGLGLILTIVAAPALINRSTAPGDMRLTLAIWGVWLPAGVATMMLVAPLLMAPFGWRGLWVAAALACVLAVVLLIRVMPGSVSRPGSGTPVSLVTAMVMTARRPAAWVLAGCFIAYSMSFMSVFGFLPTLMVEEVGLATGTASVLCAIAVLFNAVGNVLAGAAARRGIARWVLIAGPFVTLTLCSILVYSSGLPFWLRYGAALFYALTGGLLPATIMGSLPVFAARPDLVGTMSGFVMQGSNIGQLIGPPLIAMVVAANGWQAAPFYIAGATGLGLILALRLRPLERGLGKQH